MTSLCIFLLVKTVRDKLLYYLRIIKLNEKKTHSVMPWSPTLHVVLKLFKTVCRIPLEGEQIYGFEFKGKFTVSN